MGGLHVTGDPFYQVSDPDFLFKTIEKLYTVFSLSLCIIWLMEWKGSKNGCRKEDFATLKKNEDNMTMLFIYFTLQNMFVSFSLSCPESIIVPGERSLRSKEDTCQSSCAIMHSPPPV